jgi:hypothetical protein
MAMVLREPYVLKVKKEDKAIPVTGRGGLYGCEMLRIPHCIDSRLRDGVEIVSLTFQPLYSLQTFLSLVLIPVRG